MSVRCFIDFASGDAEAYQRDLKQFQELERWLEANGAKYGLPQRLDALDESGRETLAAVYEGDTKVRCHSVTNCSS